MHSCVFSPSRCYIDLSCLTKNFQALGDASKLLAVIKSDAYGHGLLPCAKALDRVGAKQFAVGTVPEGLFLREKGLTQEIVPLLGAMSVDEWVICREKQILAPIVDVTSLKQAEAAAAGREFTIAIALNTGMGRLGFSIDDLPELLVHLQQSHLRPTLAFSHLACADDPESAEYTQAQEARFGELTQILRTTYPSMRLSLNNSAALQSKATHPYDLSRPGITLYGGNPFFGTELVHLGSAFSWVMSLAAPILQVHTLKKGESVSYGCIFTAEQQMRVAVVAMGYATGFSRVLSNRVEILIGGRRCRQIGRVCMGMIMVDVSAQKNVRPGELAWVLGGENAVDTPVTAQELATKMGTISYEVLCRFGAMNERIYLGA
ncbi:MAG: alanine racemase [Desulfovibrio sp.]|nr:alanine racemase [Desulfovibrio sp.]